MQLMLMLSAIFAALSVIIIRLGRILDHLEAKAARQKEQPKGKGHDAWVQAALASGDDEEIRHLQAY